MTPTSLTVGRRGPALAALTAAQGRLAPMLAGLRRIAPPLRGAIALSEGPTPAAQVFGLAEATVAPGFAAEKIASLDPARRLLLEATEPWRAFAAAVEPAEAPPWRLRAGAPPATLAALSERLIVTDAALLYRARADGGLFVHEVHLGPQGASCRLLARFESSGLSGPQLLALALDPVRTLAMLRRQLPPDLGAALAGIMDAEAPPLAVELREGRDKAGGAMVFRLAG